MTSCFTRKKPVIEKTGRDSASFKIVRFFAASFIADKNGQSSFKKTEFVNTSYQRFPSLRFFILRCLVSNEHGGENILQIKYECGINIQIEKNIHYLDLNIHCLMIRPYSVLLIPFNLRSK